MSRTRRTKTFWTHKTRMRPYCGHKGKSYCYEAYTGTKGWRQECRYEQKSLKTSVRQKVKKLLKNYDGEPYLIKH